MRFLSMRIACPIVILMMFFISPVSAQIDFIMQALDSELEHVVFIHAFDHDNDGDIDVSAGSEDLFNSVVLYENEGDSTFERFTLISEIEVMMAGAAADLDQDGDIDYVIRPELPGLSWWENIDGENFEEHGLDRFLDLCFSLDITDLNGDELPDIVACTHAESYLLLWINQGQGEFSYVELETSNFSNFLVKGDDFDLDGDMDLLVVADNDELYCLRQDDNNMIFEQVALSGEVNDIETFIPVDIDGDGDKDIACGSTHAPYLFWYENTGDSDFLLYSLSNFCSSAYNVTPADINFDGNTDLLVTTDLGLIWLENTGDATFVDHLIDPEVEEGKALYCIDLNNDTGIDILVGSETSPNVRLWMTDPAILPRDFNLLSPENGAMLDSEPITFSWEAIQPVPDASYTLELSFLYDFDEYDSYPVEQNTTADISGLELHEVYYWQVLAEIPYDNSEIYSNQIWAFSLLDTEADGYSRVQLPGEFSVFPAYPNPFNSASTVILCLPRPEFINAAVYNLAGRFVDQLFSGVLPAGRSSLSWQPQTGSGTYFLRVTQTDGVSRIVKLQYIK